MLCKGKVLKQTCMIKKNEVYEIGLFNKPHGLHGEISLTFNDDIFDRVEAPYLVCEMDGILVPFFIESYRFKSDSTALIKLEDVDSADWAKRFTNVHVFFPKALAKGKAPEQFTWNYFIGFTLFTAQNKYIGKVIDVDTSTPNVLFLVQTEDDNEIMIPAHESMIQELDNNERILYMDLPEGLID